jgi:hypothetical protein
VVGLEARSGAASIFLPEPGTTLNTKKVLEVKFGIQKFPKLLVATLSIPLPEVDMQQFKNSTV